MIEKVQTRPAGYPRPPKRIALNLIPRNLPLSRERQIAKRTAFDLEVMRGASVANRLLVEFPCPVRWRTFQRQPFCCRSGDHCKPGAQVGGQRILRKLALFGGRGVTRSRSESSLDHSPPPFPLSFFQLLPNLPLLNLTHTTTESD